MTKSALANLSSNPQARLYLSMMWVFAARSSDIGQLRIQDVNLGEASNAARVGLTLREGKGSKFAKPYPTHAFLLRCDATLLQQMCNLSPPHCRLFHDSLNINNAVKAALRRSGPSLEMRSVRRGAAQLMADSNVPAKDFMRLTGHKSEETLQGVPGSFPALNGGG